MMDMKRVEILKCFPTELLLQMLDDIHELDDEQKQIALEEMVYVLYEREVKKYE